METTINDPQAYEHSQPKEEQAQLYCPDVARKLMPRDENFSKISITKGKSLDEKLIPSRNTSRANESKNKSSASMPSRSNSHNNRDLSSNVDKNKILQEISSTLNAQEPILTIGDDSDDMCETKGVSPVDENQFLHSHEGPHLEQVGTMESTVPTLQKNLQGSRYYSVNCESSGKSKQTTRNRCEKECSREIRRNRFEGSKERCSQPRKVPKCQHKNFDRNAHSADYPSKTQAFRIKEKRTHQTAFNFKDEGSDSALIKHFVRNSQGPVSTSNVINHSLSVIDTHRSFGADFQFIKEPELAESYTRQNCRSVEEICLKYLMKDLSQFQGSYEEFQWQIRDMQYRILCRAAFSWMLVICSRIISVFLQTMPPQQLNLWINTMVSLDSFPVAISKESFEIVFRVWSQLCDPQKLRGKSMKDFKGNET